MRMSNLKLCLDEMIDYGEDEEEIHWWIDKLKLIPFEQAKLHQYVMKIFLKKLTKDAKKRQIAKNY